MAKSPQKYSQSQIVQSPASQPTLDQGSAPSTFVLSTPAPLDFLAGIHKTDVEIAESLIQYFQVPESGVTEITKYNKDGTTETVNQHFFTPLPLFSEIAHVIGITEDELFSLGKQFPKTIGRAIQFGQDTIKTFGLRRGLTGFYDSQMTKFLLTNETNMKEKSEQSVKFVDQNKLFDQLQASNKPMVYDDEQGY